MIHQRCAGRRLLWVEPVAAPPAGARRGRRGRLVVLLLLGGLLALCHGCHGDEDTELFARMVRPLVQHGQPGGEPGSGHGQGHGPARRASR